MGVATHAYPESALAVLLSRTPLDLVMGASHHTKNHPIETPQLSLPPCPMRVLDPKGYAVASLPGGSVQLQTMWS